MTARARQTSRRGFLAGVTAAGGALALGFEIPFGPRPARASRAGPEITAWIVIEPDDAVIIRVAKSEMGQGAFTALPMLVAEELECDWSRVKAEYAEPHESLGRNRAWGDMSTGGSRSIRTSHELLRRAGATARHMLIGAAAAHWDVPAAECRAENSVITHVPSGRAVTFGRVAAAADTGTTGMRATSIESSGTRWAPGPLAQVGVLGSPGLFWMEPRCTDCTGRRGPSGHGTPRK